MSIYITQLIYIKEGQEKVFDEFESKVIPIISKYNGKLILRLRPTPETIIEKNTETPYELHLVEFESEEDFKHFLQDEERKKILHLKDQSLRTSLLIKGASL
jgi:uncharacterized protein (DUF1330 family)